MAYDVSRPPGEFAKTREREASRVALAFTLLVVAASVFSVATVLAGGVGAVGAAALLAAAYGAGLIADHRLDASMRWGKGGNAERTVGETLKHLRYEGYVVMHDLDKVVGGNVDHLVWGPTGVFMIETKFRRYVTADLPKARGIAAKLKRDLDAKWVQPVICLATRSFGPRDVRGVTVVGVDGLLGYIRSQRQPPPPFENLARFADGQ